MMISENGEECGRKHEHQSRNQWNSRDVPVVAYNEEESAREDGAIISVDSSGKTAADGSV
jgi:hypothetical protein